MHGVSGRLADCGTGRKSMLYDRDIRDPLCMFLEEQFGRVRLMDEKIIGKSRADLVMVLPGALAGIEIKSDADSYARLSRQTGDYNRIFDYNFIAVGTRHAMHVEEHVPDWWGIITVEEIPGGVDCYLLRKGRKNPDADPAQKLLLLWRTELSRILKTFGLPAYAGRNKKYMAEKILSAARPEQVAEAVSAELFERDYTGIEKAMPASRPRGTGRGKRSRRKKL